MRNIIVTIIAVLFVLLNAAAWNELRADTLKESEEKLRFYTACNLAMQDEITYWADSYKDKKMAMNTRSWSLGMLAKHRRAMDNPTIASIAERSAALAYDRTTLDTKQTVATICKVRYLEYTNLMKGN